MEFTVRSLQLFLLFLTKEVGFYKTAQPVLEPPTQELDRLGTKNS